MRADIKRNVTNGMKVTVINVEISQFHNWMYGLSARGATDMHASA
jgi:hypothetical protein